MWRPKKPLNVTWVSIINSCKSEIRLAADYIVNETLPREGLNPVRTKHSLSKRRRWGGEGRKKARRGQWEGKERKWGSHLFTLPTVQRALAFFYYCCFHWNTQREPLQRRKNKTCSFLLLKHPLSCYNCLCYSNPLGPSAWVPRGG